MTRHRVGAFILDNPPDDGQIRMVENVLATTDYPWRRILPAVRRDPDQAVIIRWLSKTAGGTGLFYGGSYEIHLGMQYDGWEDGVDFVLAHELGHLVDRATLRDEDRDALTALLHASPPTHRDRPGEWSHDNPHNENWTRRDKPYYLMLNEAYADLWVRTFAPSLMPGDPDKWVRFTHWTDDIDAVRNLTLRRSIDVFSDVPEGHPHREGIERAAELGLVGGYPDGTFRPEDPLTRGQAATIAVRQYDRMLADVR